MANLRTSVSVFDNQASTAGFVALNAHSCTEVILTVAPSGVAGTPAAILARRGSTLGWVYVEEGMYYPIGVRGNSSEIQIQAFAGTPIVGFECKLFISGPPPGLP
jgi:hypothetical protein